jgi:hypothetical protein
VLPLREELESLVHAYYHHHKEHKQAAPESSTRRHVEERMLEVRERLSCSDVPVRASPAPERASLAHL